MKHPLIKMAGAILLAAGLSSAAHAQEPIIFVHGYANTTGVWDTMVSRFKASGYPAAKLYRFGYNSYAYNDTQIGSQLKTFATNVRSQNGNAAISIVAHSNGGLVSRAYRVFNSGASQMRRFVTLGTPHLGTQNAYSCFSPICYDMRPGSSFLNNLAGRGCDRSLWSSADQMITPTGNARCGTSTQVASVSHMSLLTDSSVYNEVRRQLQ
jgi:triacylglycerol lipase